VILMKSGDKLFKDKCFIIGEAGVNHNGDIEIAKKLIDVACDAKVDAVKFQTFKAENLVTKNAEKAKYQKETTGDGSQFEMLKKLELSYEDHLILEQYCENRGTMFISTPFDFESVDLLQKLNMPLYKVSSGDLTNIPFLMYIAILNKPMIISTGMANLGEVEKAVQAIKRVGNDQINLLHCTSNYPTAYEDVNLSAMLTLKNAFKVTVGYSDHTEGIEIPIAAVAMGAKIIEKHFTLDKNMGGPDHKASLNPAELKQMVNSIRNIEKAIGDGIKVCNKNEESTKKLARKSIVAGKRIKSGEIISYENITFKRPENGVSPLFIDEIVGKVAIYNIDIDEFINFDNVK
jgi:N,N'-diacetyllegionaminate synthase